MKAFAITAYTNYVPYHVSDGRTEITVPIAVTTIGDPGKNTNGALYKY